MTLNGYLYSSTTHLVFLPSVAHLATTSTKYHTLSPLLTKINSALALMSHLPLSSRLREKLGFDTTYGANPLPSKWMLNLSI
jgi:hypothetical protein